MSFASDPGSSAKQNEDAVAATGHALVVIDGVTAPAQLGSGCIHGTAWYARNLAGRVVVALAEHPEMHLRAALAQAVSNVAASHGNTCDLSSDGTPSATVAILRVNGDALDYLVLSDASVVIETASETLTVTDKRVEELVAGLSDSVKAVPIGSLEREERLVGFVAEQRKFRNVAGGYWLAGAIPEAADYALTGSVNLSDVRFAAAMTDGASSLVDLYAQFSWDQAAEKLTQIGPVGWIEYVRSVERTDPMGTRWRRYKKSDDATIAFMEL